MNGEDYNVRNKVFQMINKTNDYQKLEDEILKKLNWKFNIVVESNFIDVISLISSKKKEKQMQISKQTNEIIDFCRSDGKFLNFFPSVRAFTAFLSTLELRGCKSQRSKWINMITNIFSKSYIVQISRKKYTDAKNYYKNFCNLIYQLTKSKTLKIKKI